MPQNPTVLAQGLLNRMGLGAAGAELDAGSPVTLAVGGDRLITIMRVEDTLVLGAAFADHDGEALLREAAPQLQEIVENTPLPAAFAAGSLVLDTDSRPPRLGGHLDPEAVTTSEDVAEALGFLINLLDHTSTQLAPARRDPGRAV
ncbi:hypothetical protein [Streptomyces subrutilus]|uniref:hypothetical protein n=1 Tax=Streptomyces subrutilus TaxID=36818 RepID=UPI002E161588|nr:hypothetical protein OG479_01260 [Streptomyces subrutilus]